MPELIHTCYRVLDPEASVTFYEKLGLKVLRRLPIGDSAMNIFMGFEDDGPRLELTHNFDREEPYEIGSGYGHIAITVGDMDSTLAELAESGIEPERAPYSV
ncbi:MAG: VOC family protein, partial [Solirubrobacterales bacterium]